MHMYHYTQLTLLLLQEPQFVGPVLYNLIDAAAMKRCRLFTATT
jgi:hypothetical protein